MKTINLVCNRCKNKFDKPLNEYTRRIKLGNFIFYCSSSCSAFIGNNGKRNTSIIKVCPCCKTKFESSTSKKSKIHCSRSCASKISRGVDR